MRVKFELTIKRSGTLDKTQTRKNIYDYLKFILVGCNGNQKHVNRSLLKIVCRSKWFRTRYREKQKKWK